MSGRFLPGRVGTGTDPSAGRRIDWFLVILLPAAATYLYVNLFLLPNTPFLLGGDQAYFWMHGQSLLYGEQPYRDFFQFTPPGTDLFYFLLFRFFGFRIWVTNAAVLALGAALFWVCFEVASEIMERRLAWLAASLFLVFIYGKALNATHHWFSLLAVMCAVRIGQRGSSTRWPVAAGGLLGLASFFTQTRGAAALLAFAAFLFWKRFRSKETWRSLGRDELLLFLGFAIVLLAFNADYVAMVGVKRLWYFQVTYARQYMVHGLVSHSMGLPEPFSWITVPILAPYLFVYLLLPVIYLAVLRRCWRDRLNPSFRWEPVTLLAMAGLSLLVEVAFSLNWLRLYAASMPGIILSIWSMGRTKKAHRYGMAMVWALIFAFAIRQILPKHLGKYVSIETPGGKTGVSPQTRDKLQWMMEHTKPGQFMFQATAPSVYLPLQLRNPIFLDNVEANRQTRPEHIERAIRELKTKNVRFVVWSQRLDQADQVDCATEDLIIRLHNYLQQRYVRLQVFSDRSEFWERK